MKKVVVLPIIFVLVLFCQNIYAQKEVRNKDLRAIREAQREAKRLRRQGWDVSAGSLPMEKSLERSWAMQLDTDEKGENRYIFAQGNGVAGTKTAADLQAIEAAKLILAGLLESRLTAIIKTSVANNQTTNTDAETLTKVISGARNTIATKLQKVDPAYRVYREVKTGTGRRQTANGNVEAQVLLFYSYDTAKKIALEVVRKDLEKETKEVQDELQQLFGVQK